MLRRSAPRLRAHEIVRRLILLPLQRLAVLTVEVTVDPNELVPAGSKVNERNRVVTTITTGSGLL